LRVSDESHGPGHDGPADQAAVLRDDPEGEGLDLHRREPFRGLEILIPQDEPGLSAENPGGFLEKGRHAADFGILRED
jgi:hypothetical protein